MTREVRITAETFADAIGRISSFRRPGERMIALRRDHTEDGSIAISVLFAPIHQ